MFVFVSSDLVRLGADRQFKKSYAPKWIFVRNISILIKFMKLKFIRRRTPYKLHWYIFSLSFFFSIRSNIVRSSKHFADRTSDTKEIILRAPSFKCLRSNGTPTLNSCFTKIKSLRMYHSANFSGACTLHKPQCGTVSQFILHIYSTPKHNNFLPCISISFIVEFGEWVCEWVSECMWWLHSHWFAYQETRQTAWSSHHHQF